MSTFLTLLTCDMCEWESWPANEKQLPQICRELLAHCRKEHPQQMCVGAKGAFHALAHCEHDVERT